MKKEFDQLEAIAVEVITAFDVVAPPVPIETMLQQPKEGMWDEVDVNQLSGSFLSIKDYYSPRMSLARLLARHIASSPWGRERGLMQILKDEETVRMFARMLIMPYDMLMGLSNAARNPTTIRMHFEVPEDDARQRLNEIVDNM